MKRLLLITLNFLIISVGFTQPKQIYLQPYNLEKYLESYTQEKLYLHVDKNFLVAGETCWFKVYLVSAINHQPVSTSRVAYLELINNENQAVVQLKVEMTNGFGKGHIEVPSSVASGNYILRAYTKWMKNFHPDFYFHQPITIVNTFRRLYENSTIKIDNIDAQFFPEGGQYIDQIESKIAFRVTDQTGKGVDFTGVIVDSSGDSVLSFEPHKFGIGHFKMTPTALEDYSAIILHKGQLTKIKLPKVVKQGFALKVTDSLDVFNITVKGMGIADQSLHLLAHTRSEICISSILRLEDGIASLKISKADLEAGITHITLFNNEGQPLCERLIFTKPSNTDALKVSINQNKFSTRKKVNLDVSINYNVFSNLSIAVVRNDSLHQFKAPDILNYLLLTSDLKGKIESVDYYLQSKDDAIDNLMLTHGWSRFRWDRISELNDFQFVPEYRGLLIEGYIRDKETNQSLLGTIGYISSPNKKIEFGGAVSNNKGAFFIDGTHLKGSTQLILQSPNKKAKIEIVSPYSNQFISQNLPPITLSEQNASALITRSISMQLNDTFSQNKDTLTGIDSTTFYGTAPETYMLDDYTRFPVMEEVMREYVKSVWVRRKGDQFIFKIVDRDRGDILENESLVLLDGVPIFNLNDIMEFDPLKIKQLDIIPGRYFVGSLAFDGIVSYRTYKGDLGGFKFSSETVMIDYEGLQQAKEFYSPRYETVPEINSRIPDGRHLLYWNPEVQISGNETKQLEFYTSDQPGRYKAIVQGITADGRPLYGETTFTVVR